MMMGVPIWQIILLAEVLVYSTRAGTRRHTVVWRSGEWAAWRDRGTFDPDEIQGRGDWEGDNGNGRESVQHC